MGRLSLHERGIAVGQINACLTQTDLSAISTRFSNFLSFLQLKMYNGFMQSRNIMQQCHCIVAM